MSDYIYAVTRVHNQEARMLDGADLQRLLAAETAEEGLRILRAKGWGAQDTADAESLLSFERARAWSLVEELVGDARPLALFQLDADFHNLKVALKLTYLDQGLEAAGRYLLPGGALDPGLIFSAVTSRDFSLLPDEMAETARAAGEALLHAGNGQLADAIVDAGALTALDRAGRASSSPLMREYARVSADAALARIAWRAGRMGMGRDYLALAMPAVGSLDRARLIEAALAGPDQVADFLAATEYAEAARLGKSSQAALERWFDDRLMRSFRPQRHVYDGIEPIAAYLLAREREIEAARLILSAKQNGLSREKVEERLRALYV